MLAENAVGFLGSLLHSWERMDADHGTGSWRMYPLAPLLVNDKVLFYQYWATSAVSKPYLAWNLAFGSMLNYTLIAKQMIGPASSRRDSAAHPRSRWTVRGRTPSPSSSPASRRATRGRR